MWGTYLVFSEKEDRAVHPKKYSVADLHFDKATFVRMRNMSEIYCELTSRERWVDL